MRTSLPLLLLVLEATLAAGSARAGAAVATFDGGVVDPTRGREIRYRIYHPTTLPEAAPLILVSHGGNGSQLGYTRLGHLGTEYASRGYVAIHVNHAPSAGGQNVHMADRPRDVSHLLDRIAAADLALPAMLVGKIDPGRVGHIGHSYGAYTTMALAGGVFDNGQPSFLDPRILAHVALSPQGQGNIGSYDDGPGDNTWRSISKPMFNLIGEREQNATIVCDAFIEAGWRRRAFERYPEVQDKYQAIVPDACHDDMGSEGTPEQQAYIAENSAAFFDVYLRGEAERVCEIGRLAWIVGTELDAKFDPVTGLPAACEPATIRTSKLRMRDQSATPANPARRLLAFSSSTRKDAADHRITLPAAGGFGDPTQRGAVLTVTNATGSGESFQVLLPASGWTRSGAGPRLQYRYRAADRGAEPVRKVTVRADSLSITAGGSLFAYTLDEPAQGAIGVELRLGVSATWCAEAPAKQSGNPPSTTRNDTIDKFVGEPNTPAPAACTSGSPSGAFLDCAAGL